jgi:hypothetical protein
MSHGQPELHVLHQPNQAVDVLQQVSQQQLQQELQPVHVLQVEQGQQVAVLVDQSQAIRSKLENIAYQLHSLNNSEPFQRLHLASNWRLSEKNQVGAIFQ